MEKMHQIAEKLRQADTIALFTHVNPDGDALGSAFAVKRILERMGKMVDFYLEQEIPGQFAFLAADYHIGEATGSYSAALCVDCGDAKRLGSFAGFYAAQPLKISIDHHLSNGGFADIEWIDSEAAATCELIFLLSKQLMPDMDSYTQACLFTGLSTDTGNFKFSNVTARTFHMAGELVEMGLHIREITKILYDTVKLSKLKFTGAVADRIQLYQEGRLAVLEAPDSFLAQYGLKQEDVNELPSIPLSLEGVLVSVLVKDNAEGKKYSLRGKEVRDLSAVAGAFGGGGHKNAAGFTSDVPVGEVIARLQELLQL